MNQGISGRLNHFTHVITRNVQSPKLTLYSTMRSTAETPFPVACLETDDLPFGYQSQTADIEGRILICRKNTAGEHLLRRTSHCS